MSGNVSVYSHLFKYLLKMLTDCKWKISVLFKTMCYFLIILHKTLWYKHMGWFFFILQYVNLISHFPTYEGQETSLPVNKICRSTFGEHKICISKNLVAERRGCRKSSYSIIKSRHYIGSSQLLYHIAQPPVRPKVEFLPLEQMFHGFTVKCKSVFEQTDGLVCVTCMSDGLTCVW